MRSTQAENYAPFGLEIYFFYNTDIVTVNKEVLLYNLPQLLSAAGGTLGMYLGLSLYSVMSDSFDLFGFAKKN